MSVFSLFLGKTLDKRTANVLPLHRHARLQHTLPSRKHHILHPNLHTQTVRQQVAEPFFSRISHSETPRSPHSSAAEKLAEGLGKVIPSRPVTFLQHSCSNLTGQLEKCSKAPGALLQLCWRKFTARVGKRVNAFVVF